MLIFSSSKEKEAKFKGVEEKSIFNLIILCRRNKQILRREKRRKRNVNKRKFRLFNSIYLYLDNIVKELKHQEEKRN